MDPTDLEISDPKLGTRVADRYRLDARLAAGGMGVVYKGVDLQSQKPVAVKFLHDALAGVPDLVKRFKREVEVMRRLSHPNLVGVLDSGVQAGVPWLVMDFHDGKPLADVLERGALTPPRSVGLALQVLAGVGHAHAQGVLHRDLKPDNILLVQQGDREQVKILDFGLAKLLADEGGTQLTNTGFAIGTPAYMAPEQARGAATDERTDLYSIGVVLYHMVVGKKPFVAESPLAVLRMHMDDEPVPPRKAAPDQKLSSALDGAIVRALAKEPAQRWQSAADLTRALEATPEARASDPGRTRFGFGRLRRRAASSSTPGVPLGRVIVLAVGIACAAGLLVWSRLTRVEKQRMRRSVSSVQHNLTGPVRDKLEDKLASAVDATKDALRSMAQKASPIDSDDGDNDDDAVTPPSAAPRDTPGARLEAASHPQAHPRKSARPATLPQAIRLLSAGKLDEAIQTLFQIRQKSPRSPAVALYLGHAYFRKGWRTDGLREYDAALALKPSLRRDRLLVHNVVAALDDPTSRLARAVIRNRLGTAALGELRRAARAAKSPKVQKRAARLAARLAPPRRRRRR